MEQIILCLFSIRPPKKPPQHLRQRQDEHSGEDIADAVDDIEGKSGCDPGKRLGKVKAEHKRLTGGVKDAERKAVERADYRIDDGGDLFRHFFREEHGYAPEDRPHVGIGEPPRIEACVHAVYEDVEVDRDKRPPRRKR